MADVGSTPLLKRKREGAEAQRKKPKTSKSKPATGGDSAPSETKSTAPETRSTPKSTVGKPIVTPEVRAAPKKLPTLQNAQANGTSAASTPPSSRTKDKLTPKAQKVAGTDTVIEEEKALAPSSTAVAGEHKKKERRLEPWSISAPQGGWFLPQDPVFSPDEKYLLLGKLKSLDVYAADTSLLVRSLPLGASSVALAYAISSINADLVYVADSAGIVSLWNWTDGSKLGRWAIGVNVQHLVVVEQPTTSRDLVFTHEADSKHILNVHALYTGEEAAKTEVKQILRTSRPITGIQVLLQGKLVVLSTPNSMIIGKRRKFKQTALQDFEYTWREFETSKRITTFNAFVQTAGGKDKALEDARDHLDLAVGDEEGVIYLFEDVISRFVAVEKSQKDTSNKKVGPESLTPKRLHWHRTAVRSLKYSLDGNYLISGGDETVLTIWQLSTGKQQHLPHLTAAIESIAVSPSGASYGVTLANNSVIVLSTSELKAKTNIVGIQTRRISAGKLHRLSNPHFSPKYLTLLPMDTDPNNNNYITFVTPSSQPRHGGASRSEPYIQTFDLANSLPIARQPLTRNNATDPNMGPEGRPILEPSVNLLRFSHDGAWLATVDEWVPPTADLSYIEEGISAFNTEERILRREVYLKIWRRDEHNAHWVLDARIDAPHFIQGVSAHARVFDLIADPSGVGFATVGEDRVVRIWRPKTRMRDGVVVRGAERMRGLVTWSLDRVIQLADKLEIDEARELSHSTIPRTSRLAFSADGSVLAVGISWASDEEPGVVHIVDTNNGSVRRSITEIDISALSGVAILGRHLILLGSTVIVWDMILDQLVYSIPNKTPGVRIATHSQLLSLAINEEDDTFAVSTPRLQKKEPEDDRFTRIATKVTVYRPVSSEPIWSCTIPEALVLGLVATKGGRGFITLDTSSHIRMIAPTVATLQLPSLPLEPTSKATKDIEVDQDGTDDVEETAPQIESSLQLSINEYSLDGSENDKPIVRPEQLQQIFDGGPSHALPPIRNLFNAVLGLYGRKPRVHTASAA